MKPYIILLLLLSIVTGCGKYSSGGTKGEEPTDSLVALAVQYEMGRRYYEGDGVERNFKKAFEWYTQAAEQGLAEAQYKLGECYHYGWGVEWDYEKAFTWYTQAAEQGFTEAQYKLGECYHYGWGVEWDYEKAVEWYTKAAEQGFTEAQYKLGECYYYGNVVEQDYVKAVKWFTMAAEQRLVKAQCALGYCYYCGDGVEQDYGKAEEWLTKAAEQGDDEAQYFLGECYDYGRGVEQDLEKAAEWYAKAAKHNRFAEDALEFFEEYRNSGNASSQFSNSKKVSELTGYINGHKYVDLGLSVKWAACNVGASSPEEYGDCFAWGETSTKSGSTEKNNKTPDVSTGSIAGNPQYDAARANWGGTWRLPTGREIYELVFLGTWDFCRRGGILGYKVTGPNGNSIFLPSYSYEDDIAYYGYYWSASHRNEDNEHYAFALTFVRAYGSPTYFTQWVDPRSALAVRPVSE